MKRERHSAVELSISCHLTFCLEGQDAKSSDSLAGSPVDSTMLVAIAGLEQEAGVQLQFGLGLKQ